MIKINFSYEFYLNQNYIRKIIFFKKKISLKPNFITITYNNIKINRKIIIYFIKKKIKIFPHLVCKKNVKNFNYFLNLYYINNLKNILLIKGDEKKSDFYYSYNLINIIKKNYKNIYNIYFGIYPEFHPVNLLNYFDIKNIIIKKKFKYKKSIFITQYFYNFESYYYFLENLKKNRKNLKISIGIIIIENFKKLLSFSKICKAEIPIWFFKKINNNFDKNFFKKINKEVVINLIIKIIKFKKRRIHIYTMNNLNISNNISENLNNILNI